METYILAACFFTSIVANVVLMAGLLAKRQRTSIEFSGSTLQVQLHQGNVHLITGLVLYEKGRHSEAIAMLQEAVRLDPDDRMAESMLQIALNSGGGGVAGLPPGQPRRRLSSRAGADADGILDAVIQDVAADETLLTAGADAPPVLAAGSPAEMAGGPEATARPAASAAPAPDAPPVSVALAADLLAGAEADIAEAVRDGLTTLRQGDVAGALAHFQALTAAHPDSRIARTGQAIALKHAGRDDEAAEVLRLTLQEPAGTETPVPESLA